jgi:hypothetical protein
MAGQTVLSQKRKKRGPAPTGKGELIGVRLQPAALSAVDAWIAGQDDHPSRPEAIRRLVERGLLAKDPREKPARKGGPRMPRAAADTIAKLITAAGLAQTSKKSAEMAGAAIDRIDDVTASAEDRARRKRRLIKGPTEFRELRGKKPKA